MLWLIGVHATWLKFPRRQQQIKMRDDGLRPISSHLKSEYWEFLENTFINTIINSVILKSFSFTLNKEAKDKHDCLLRQEVVKSKKHQSLIDDLMSKRGSFIFLVSWHMCLYKDTLTQNTWANMYCIVSFLSSAATLSSPFAVYLSPLPFSLFLFIQKYVPPPSSLYLSCFFFASPSVSTSSFSHRNVFMLPALSQLLPEQKP